MTQERTEVSGALFSTITDALNEVTGFRALELEQQRVLFEHLRVYARLINPAFASSNPSENNKLPNRGDLSRYVESYKRVSDTLGGKSWAIVAHSEQIVAAVMISNLRSKLKEKIVEVTEAKSDAYVRTLQEGREYS